jgi:hypothetical protein
MAIRVEHGPSMALMGRMSYGAGKAIGEEESQRNLLDKWMQYYGVKKPLEVQERIADKNLAYQREDLGARNRWFDQNYILDEKRVGFEGDRVGIEKERVGIDRSRLGIDQQLANQQLQIATMNAAMQGQIAQYQAQTSANEILMQRKVQAPYQRPNAMSGIGSIGGGNSVSYTPPSYASSSAPTFNYQSILGQYGYK